jgi:DNA ligase-1
MELPTLYTLTGRQFVRYWQVRVIVDDDEVYVCREYGKQGGKPIINKKLISEIKSQQTVYDQAVFEAKKDWKEMTEKKGYVTNRAILSDTTSQLSRRCSIQIVPKHIKRDEDEEGVIKPRLHIHCHIRPRKFRESEDEIDVIQPRKAAKPASDDEDEIPSSDDEDETPPPFKFLPMLANKWVERKRYVTYPCLVQPKLDGVRYTARKLSASNVVLKTRNDAECPFFTEIKDAIRELDLDPNVFLDGEFYSKRIPFRTLNGYCNRKKLDGKTGYNTIPPEDLQSIHYYIFDCYFVNEPNKPFAERYQYLESIMSDQQSDYLQLVHSDPVEDESDIQQWHDLFVKKGYEGIMIRNADSSYKLKDRSNDLLKYKNFQDREFIIVGAKTPANGKEEGCIIWELQVPDTDLMFTCRPRDSYDSRKEDWLEYQRDPSQFLGHRYTVRFQETYENGIPRFPRGIAIRYDL